MKNLSKYTWSLEKGSNQWPAEFEARMMAEKLRPAA
jgi:hypothetical protein